MKYNAVVCVVLGLLLSIQVTVADEAGDLRNQIRAAQKELSSLTRGGWQSHEYAAAKKVYDEMRAKEKEKKEAKIRSKPECAELVKQAAELRAQEAEAKKKMSEFQKSLDADPDIQALKKAHEDARKLERAAGQAVREKIAEKMKANPEIEAAKVTADKAGKEARDLDHKMNSLLVADNTRVAELQAKIREMQAKYDAMKKEPAKKKAPRKKKDKKEE